jgi:hypothetical protein
MLLHYVRKKIAIVLYALLWTAVVIFCVPLRTTTLIKSAAISVSVFIVFAIIIQYALTRRFSGRTKAASNRWLIFGSVIFCATIWSVYGVVFYPGLISWDFFVQWYEMSGKAPRSDWHPFFHTSLIWLLTRIWFSPAALMIAQIGFMSAIVGMAVWTLHRIGVSSLIIAALVLFYAFFPLNGFYAVSLWKDISYSVVFLWLILLFIRISSVNGKEIARKNVFLQLFFSLCCIAMMRHNGIVPAFGSLAILFVLHYRSQLKSVTALSIAVIAAVTLFRGPILDRLGVEVKSRKAAKAQVLVQHIGAVLNDGGELAEEDKPFLSNILPLAHWKGGYQARSCMPLICGKDAQGRAFFNGLFLQDDANYKKFLTIWARLASQYPMSILRYYTDATELIWRIQSSYGIFIIPDEGLTVNDLYSGYTPSPPLKEQTGKFGKFLIHLLLGHPSVGWFLYRGALYFWLSIFFLSLTFIRSGKLAVPVVAAPMLLQVATVAAFPLAQDTRYMFPVILAAPVFVALYFSPKFSNPYSEKDAESISMDYSPKSA